jgi:hypothetical protein
MAVTILTLVKSRQKFYDIFVTHLVGKYRVKKVLRNFYAALIISFLNSIRVNIVKYIMWVKSDTQERYLCIWVITKFHKYNIFKDLNFKTIIILFINFIGFTYFIIHFIIQYLQLFESRLKSRYSLPHYSDPSFFFLIIIIIILNAIIL